MIGSWRNPKKDNRKNNTSSNTATEGSAEPTAGAPRQSFKSRDLFLPRGLLASLIILEQINNFIVLFYFYTDIQEVQDNLPSTCKFRIPNPNELFKQELVVTPSKDSMWHGGKFKFVIDIPPDYKYSVRFFTPLP